MKKQQEILAKIQEYIQAGVFPGADFALLEKNEVHEFIQGNAAIFPEKITLTKGKNWDLASVTKVVGTGTAVIDLILAGKLEVDAPLQDYYPEFADASVTLRQLLTHTSGIDPYIPNRNQLNASELTEAINHIKVTADKTFKYTDINFILLGFLLEKYYDASLDQIFSTQIFEKWQMTKTRFGPVKHAVPTSQTTPVGSVHDPKAQVLGVHCGAAGLFAPMEDLIKFCQAYFADEKYFALQKNYAKGAKKRSLAWDLARENEEWLLHTGYTGTFILLNPKGQKAAIFLSNRVHLKDEREKWIEQRDDLIKLLLESLTDE